MIAAKTLGAALSPSLASAVATAPALLQACRRFSWTSGSTATTSGLKQQANQLQERYSDLHHKFHETVGSHGADRPKAHEWQQLWQHQVRTVSHHQSTLRSKGAARDTAQALRRAEQVHRELETSLSDI